MIVIDGTAGITTSNITSSGSDVANTLTLTNALSIASGGTGSSTATAALSALGAAALNTFTSALGANGYQKLPSGLIIQWGTASTVAGSYTNLVFPIAFPTALLSITGNFQSTTVVGGGWSLLFSTAGTHTTSVPVAASNSTSLNFATNFTWIATGY